MTLHEIICFRCKKDFGYEGEKYQDIKCPYCQVLNSVYEPEQKKEKEMYPPNFKKDFEKVKIGEFINGVVEEMQYDMEHKFNYQGIDKIVPAIRFKFQLEGYNFAHFSRWMTFSTSDKTNLYNKYLLKLVENAQPEMSFDFNELRGFKVKMIWTEKNDFQNIEAIYPLDKKLVVNTVKPEKIPVAPSETESHVEENLEEENL